MATSHPTFTAKHAAIRDYYKKRDELAAQGVEHEMAVRESFKGLLEQAGGAAKWTLVVEQRVEGLREVVRPDGTMRDANTLPRGYWEAKDTKDDLDAEIDKKTRKGYPTKNIIYEDTRRAVLIQNGERVGDYDLAQPEQVATLMTRFCAYNEPNIAGFEQAVERFRSDTPELARGLLKLIDDAHKNNKKFQAAFADFFEICKTALNPNISRDAVNEMLIQHLLTERLMRTVFDNPDFARRNAIAGEVETVIDALTSKSFSRTAFLGQLDYLYEAIEHAAQTLSGFRERQTFINTVYERFFQGYAVKVADTHGIVYTPQPIVDFMCAAVEEVLHDEFGMALDDPKVCIIDPCTGTGNFIINLLNRIATKNPAALPDVYKHRLFANEVMLLPYYVASLNIEHAYLELAGQYEPFEGLCFVDTLDLAERTGGQTTFSFMSEANSARVQRQKATPITVIIGNPPYNAKQQNENDNNKNRVYEVVDRRVSESYARDSKASNRNRLNDAYVKFFRWASDRLQGRDGIVCYVSNNGFIDGIGFDGMRKHLYQDFSRIYHIDLHGNVRQNTKLSGTTHNVFGIQVGVGITIAVRHSSHSDRKIFYHRVPEFWRKEEKLGFLAQMVASDGEQNALNTVTWEILEPDARQGWRKISNTGSYDGYLPLGSKEAKKAKFSETIFKTYSLGLNSARDDTVFNYNRERLIERVQPFIDYYNGEVDRYRRAGKPKDVDNFVKYDFIKWSRDLKADLVRGSYAEYNEGKVRVSQYRPFNKRFVFLDRILNEEVYGLPSIFPTPETFLENCCICVSFVGSERPFFAFVTQLPIALSFVGGGGGAQTFPFYVYDEDGTNRRENITDWALAQFQTQYSDPTISKWDVFYHVYGALHHAGYRERYADNLKRDLPRIPFAPTLEDFRAICAAGQKLADLHLNYESVEPYPLTYKWTKGKPASWRVEKMRLTKDKTALKVNDSLVLEGIPAAAFDYKLGSRSALDWVIDQYQVKTDKRSGITSDPNQYSEDEQYIVKLVGRVVRVSVETVELVNGIRGRALV